MINAEARKPFGLFFRGYDRDSRIATGERKRRNPLISLETSGIELLEFVVSVERFDRANGA